MKRLKDKRCLFCIWANDLENVEKELGKEAADITIDEMAQRFSTSNDKPWKSQFITANKHFFAVLSREPKIEGHTLVISRRHFSGIANNSLIGKNDEFKIAFFDITTEMAHKLANLTQDKQSPKVHVMSICEHWKTRDLGNANALSVLCSRVHVCPLRENSL